MKSNLIFDVGMHKGEDTDFYIKKGFDVIGFEANPDLVKYLKIKFEKEINSKKLILIEGAVVDKNFHEKVFFYKNKKNTVWGTILKDWAERNAFDDAESEVIEVNSINFRECLEKYGIPYYMKIDIEGMDLFCCETLLHFDEKPKFISIESEKIKYEQLCIEINLFEKLGYNKFKVIQQDGISKQKEKLPCTEGKYLDYKFLEGSSGLFGNDLPGEWLSSQETYNKYKKIFYYYKMFGDNSLLRKFFLTKIMLKLFRKLTGIPTPGWYDTHAKHSGLK